MQYIPKWHISYPDKWNMGHDSNYMQMYLGTCFFFKAQLWKYICSLNLNIYPKLLRPILLPGASGGDTYGTTFFWKCFPKKYFCSLFSFQAAFLYFPKHISQAEWKFKSSAKERTNIWLYESLIMRPSILHVFWIRCCKAASELLIMYNLPPVHKSLVIMVSKWYKRWPSYNFSGS